MGKGGPLLNMWVESVSVGYPGKKHEDSASSRLTPRECRERGLTYQGTLMVNLCYQVCTQSAFELTEVSVVEIPVYENVFFFYRYDVQ